MNPSEKLVVVNAFQRIVNYYESRLINSPKNSFISICERLSIELLTNTELILVQRYLKKNLPRKRWKNTPYCWTKADKRGIKSRIRFLNKHIKILSDG